ncbi:MAG TPA: hypothetical protein PKM88_08775 [bacterium]|nr:hypothetical protein [bacterium]
MSALLAGVIFSAVGLGAFIYGKRQTNAKFMLVGALLMGYSYVCPGDVWPWVVGLLLTGSLFYSR